MKECIPRKAMCTRCGQIFYKNPNQDYIGVSLLTVASRQLYFHMCDDCVDKFKDFMKGERK